MTELEMLLLGASAEIIELKRENARLRRELGYRRLVEDLRAEFDLSADELPALLRPQV